MAKKEKVAAKGKTSIKKKALSEDVLTAMDGNVIVEEKQAAVEDENVAEPVNDTAESDTVVAEVDKADELVNEASEGVVEAAETADDVNVDETNTVAAEVALEAKKDNNVRRKIDNMFGYSWNGQEIEY